MTPSLGRRQTKRKSIKVSRKGFKNVPDNNCDLWRPSPYTHTHTKISIAAQHVVLVRVDCEWDCLVVTRPGSEVLLPNSELARESVVDETCSGAIPYV